MPIPPAIRTLGDSKSSVTDKEYADATAVQAAGFDFLDPPNKEPKHKIFFEDRSQDDDSNGKVLPYANERELQGYVQAYLDGAISAGGLKKTIETYIELYIGGYRPDIVIITSQDSRAPRGIVEVKLPSDDDDDDGGGGGGGPTGSGSGSGAFTKYPKTAAALAAAADRRHAARLLLLQQTAASSATATTSTTKGKKKAASDTVAASSTNLISPMDSKRFQGQIFDYLLILKSIYGVNDPVGIMTTYDEWRICWLDSSSSDSQRTFCASKIMQYNDPELPRYIMTALVRMARATISDLPVKKDRSYPYMTTKKFTWKVLGVDLDSANFPAPSSENFYLLKDLGGGAEGKAWLACNSSGRKCVVKLFKVKEGTNIKKLEEGIESEMAIWRQAFGVSALFRVVLSGSPALVMPLLRVARTGASLDPGEEVRLVKEAVKAYVRQGKKKAQDLKWHHVGFIGEGQDLKAILFDTRPADCDDDLEAAEEEMLQKLGLL